MITPSDSSAVPAQYNAVPVQSLNIQAPQEDLSAAVSEAMSTALSRQPLAEALLASPVGFATDGYDIQAGYSGTWGVDKEPDVAGP
jgi:hypothetical protein